MGKEMEASGYDAIYSKKAKYSEHYKKTRWYRRYLLTALRVNSFERILEMGCGTGQLAHLLFDSGCRKYKGYDFSDVAIQKCNDLRLDSFKFFVDDIYKPELYKDYDVFLCCETLEHVKDFEVLKNVEKGKKIVLSLPDFPAPNHLFCIKSPEQLKERYKDVIEFSYIEKVDAWFVGEGVKL